MSHRLRLAIAADAYALWLWANDADTRAASNGRAPIAWSDHTTWFHERLNNGAAAVLMLELNDDRPVGCIRFESADDWKTARLSYVIAPEERGAGLARTLVSSGLNWLRDRHPGVEVRADVMPDNVRSMHVFEALNWEGIQVAGAGWQFHSRSRTADREA
jgi:RimJ/RimL family protein N-acetyltransferase